MPSDFATLGSYHQAAAPNLRESVLAERSIAFDLASRAMSSKSPELMQGHASKAAERLAQCSPETQVYLGWLWERWLSGARVCTSAVAVQESLTAYSINHWLWQAVAGLCEAAQAIVISELTEHYHAAYAQTSETLQPHERQREALHALGKPEQVNKELRRVHLTKKEQQSLDPAGEGRRTGILFGLILICLLPETFEVLRLGGFLAACVVMSGAVVVLCAVALYWAKPAPRATVHLLAVQKSGLVLCLALLLAVSFAEMHQLALTLGAFVLPGSIASLLLLHVLYDMVTLRRKLARLEGVPLGNPGAPASYS